MEQRGQACVIRVIFSQSVQRPKAPIRGGKTHPTGLPMVKTTILQISKTLPIQFRDAVIQNADDIP